MREKRLDSMPKDTRKGKPQYGGERSRECTSLGYARKSQQGMSKGNRRLLLGRTCHLKAGNRVGGAEQDEFRDD